MTVVHLNTSDFQGGAGRAAFRLHKGLLENGLPSFLLSRHQRRGDPGVFRALDRLDEGGRSREALIAVEREVIQRKLINQNRSAFSSTIFSFPYPGSDLMDLPLVGSADILHMHWINGFLSPVTIARLGQHGTPIVWTLHDEWPYSGGCHYTAGCDKFVDRDCTNCSQLARDSHGIPNAVLRDKVELWKDLNLTLVCPSNWIAEQARRSRVFRGRRIEVIHNSVETDIFRPMDRELCREQFQIASDAVVLAFGAQTLVDRRKGFGILIEALRLALQNPAFAEKAWRGGVALLAFGRPNQELKTLGLDLIEAGEVEDDVKLARLLNCADAVVMPSIEDNYPNVMVEAMSCGVPVIGFNAGGVSDGIKDGERGVLVEPVGSAQALCDVISRLVLESSEVARYRVMGEAGRAWIAATHGLGEQARIVTDLYRDLNPNFGTGAGRSFVQVMRTLDRDTRKTPFRVRLMPDLGPAFEEPRTATLIRELVDEARESAGSLTPPLPVEYGETLKFDPGSSAFRALGHGWSRPEANGVWSASRSATLRIRCPRAAGKASLVLRGFSFGGKQPVRAFANGEEIGKFTLDTKPGEHRLPVPPALVSGESALIVDLLFDKARPPENAADQRILGMKLQELQVIDAARETQTGLEARKPALEKPSMRSGAPAYRWGDTVPTQSESGRGYLVRGNRREGFVFRAQPSRGNVVGSLEVSLLQAGGKTQAQPIQLWADDRFMGDVALKPNRRSRVHVEFAGDVFSNYAVKHVAFEAPRADATVRRRLVLHSFELRDGQRPRYRADGRAVRLTADDLRPDIAEDFKLPSAPPPEARSAPRAVPAKTASRKKDQAEGYAWGQTIDFLASGNSRPFLAEGWTAPDERGTFTLGDRAELVLPGHASPRGGSLILQVVGGCTFDIDVNDVRVWSGTAGKKLREIRAAVPAGTFEDTKEHRVAFVLKTLLEDRPARYADLPVGIKLKNLVIRLDDGKAAAEGASSDDRPLAQRIFRKWFGSARKSGEKPTRASEVGRSRRQRPAQPPPVRHLSIQAQGWRGALVPMARRFVAMGSREKALAKFDRNPQAYFRDVKVPVIRTLGLMLFR